MTIQEQAKVGVNYYRTRNKIKDRRKLIYTEAGLIDDPYCANYKIASSFFSMLVDQKVDYLIGKKPTTPIDDPEFYHNLNKIAKKASAQGVQWAYPYIKNGKLTVKLFPTSELGWELDAVGELKYMARTIKDKEGEVYIYVYTKEDIKVYKDEVKESNLQKTEPHYQVKQIAGSQENYIDQSWGVVPFIPFYNNDEMIYDLEPVKPLIDAYDAVISDYANNLEDFQDIYWVLKGYDGQDPAKFLNDVKRYKNVKVGEGGDARAETVNVPTEAREKLLDRLNESIFSFGRGVDMKKLQGGSLTNVVIKAHFTNLDQKADSFSYQVTEFINRYIDFYNIYAQANNEEQIEKQEIVYNKSMIVDEESLLTANAQQAGFISDETRWDHHPWTDAETEMERQGMETIPDNPIPTPNQEETQDEFIGRCTTFLINEGTEQEQAVAICRAQWSDERG